MLWLRDRRQTGIGIDLGTAAIKAVEIGKKGAGYRLKAAVRTATPPGALVDGAIVKAGELANTLGELVERNSWHKRPVVTAIGGRKVITRHIRLPVMPEKELASAVKWEAEKYLPFNKQDLVMDFQNLGRVEGDGVRQQLILVAAVPTEVARSYYNLMAGVDLELTAIDIIPTALVRWALSPMGMGGLETGTFAVADLGEEVSNLVVSEGGQVGFARVIPLAGSQPAKVVAHVLHQNMDEARRVKEQNAALMENGTQMGETAVSMQESQIGFTLGNRLGDLVRDMRLSLDFYLAQSPGTRPGKLILTGGTSLLPGLDRFLAQELDLPVAVGSVQTGEVGDPRATLDAGFALATGLALRGVMG